MARLGERVQDVGSVVHVLSRQFEADAGIALFHDVHALEIEHGGARFHDFDRLGVQLFGSRDLFGLFALFGGDRVYTGDQDEGYRYAFFCRAILEALPRIGWFPDILHGNDWQCGLLSVLLRAQYGIDERYRAIRAVYTIHNLKFQGLFDFHWLNTYLGLNEGYFSPENLEFYGLLSCMKGGIVFSDRVTTVSPTYAEEIKSAYYGERLDGLMKKRQHVLSGILNGIDTDAYDPEGDRFLRVTFSADNRRGKAILKADLQQECGLEVRPEAALIGFIARLTDISAGKDTARRL